MAGQGEELVAVLEIKTGISAFGREKNHLSANMTKRVPKTTIKSV
jgi:hypothetical protein